MSYCLGSIDPNVEPCLGVQHRVGAHIPRRSTFAPPQTTAYPRCEQGPTKHAPPVRTA